MSKFIVIAVLSLVASFSVVNVVSAQGAVVNRGACMSQAAPSLKRYQAPGQVGNGPLTIVSNANGVMTLTASFDGSVGCAR